MKNMLAITSMAAAALTLVLAGCASMSGGGSSIETLATGQRSNIQDQEYSDIHNQADFDALWKKAFAGVPDAPAEPAVDFSKQMVIASFIGTQKMSGWVIRVTKVDDSGPNLNVTVTVTVPGADCLFTKEGAAQPYQIAAIPASVKVISITPTQRNAAPCGT